LGQIEATSFFEFGGTRFAGTPVAVSKAFGAVAELGDRTVKFTVELMHSVVAQIRSLENSRKKIGTFLDTSVNQGATSRRSRQTHAEALL
jgi:hypothetical protein